LVEVTPLAEVRLLMGVAGKAPEERPVPREAPQMIHKPGRGVLFNKNRSLLRNSSA
jgi:hypothetical protein